MGSQAATELPLGEVLEVKQVQRPPHVPLHGRYTSLLPLDLSHSESLYRHIAGPSNEVIWTYLPHECPLTLDEFRSMLAKELSTDTLFYAVLSGPASDPASEPVGIMAYLNIVPDHRRIEIGWLALGNALKRTRKATEALYLLLRRAFDELGYERVEWKANALNAASRSAAERLGFVFEGIFRKHVVVKGRRRDSIYLSIIDSEWPVVRGGLERWLADSNFDEGGKQKRTLKECRDSAVQ